jgi:hypothetical protein
MIKADLCRFMDRVIEERSIGRDDLNRLQRTILASGISSREEVEALLALGRSLDGDPRWREVLTALIVDFVVWNSQPRGIVTAAACRWLAAALDATDQPETALHIAYAVVEEAHTVDEALLTFILRGRQRPPQGLAA